MENITANAQLNLKAEPNVLCVHGSIITYRGDDVVKITEAESDGYNPTILILDLKVTEGNGPMKGTPKAFDFATAKEIANTYKQVTIRYNENSEFTFNIEVVK